MFQKLVFLLELVSKSHTHVKLKACDVKITAFLEKYRNINFKNAVSSYRPGNVLDQEIPET
jgi:hypothetical protein